MHKCPWLVTCLFPIVVGAAAPPVRPSPDAPYAVVAHWPVAGNTRWDYLSIDRERHRLFVTRGDRVAVIDLATGKALGDVTPTDGVHGVALAQQLGKGYASNGHGDSVTVFDLATLAVVKTVPIEAHNPDAIVFDAPSRRVFTFNGRSNDATVIDAVSDTVVETVALPGTPEFAVSDGHGRVYVNIEDRAELVAIDTRKAKVVATWALGGCEEPSGLALDTARGRLFSVCANEQMTVTDARSGKVVAVVPIGKGPDAVAYDEGTHEVFSSNGRDGTLTVVRQNDADHYTVIGTVPTRTSARTLALDPASHRIYLAAADFEPAAASPAGQAQGRPAMKDGSFEIVVVAPSVPTGRR